MSESAYVLGGTVLLDVNQCNVLVCYSQEVCEVNTQQADRVSLSPYYTWNTKRLI